VIMLGEMLQYKNFHDDPTKPPFPWDPEAARWCRAYRKTHPRAFPVDRRELLRPERVKLAGQVPAEKKKARVRVLSPSGAAKQSLKVGRESARPAKRRGESAAAKPAGKVRIKSSST
jgi:hypothetical protein